MTRAPLATIGFPQSMQKRDSPSFSLPQKPQRFTQNPRNSISHPQSANIGNVRGWRLGAKPPNRRQGAGMHGAGAVICVTIAAMRPPPSVARAAIISMLGLSAGLTACRGAVPVTGPVPVAPPASQPPVIVAVSAPAAVALPPIPWVRGALALDVVYPGENHLLSVRDSTFLFGSVGSGDATLTINGAPVTVQPNGSFLAFLPVPVDTAYRLEASLPAGERASMVRRVRYPARATGGRAAPVVIDTAGYPRTVTLLNSNVDATSDTDMVTIVRPTAGGTYKWFLLPGTLVQATGRLNASVRIRLDEQLDAWVDSVSISAQAATPPSVADAAPKRRTIASGRVAVGAGYSDIVFPMTSRAPYLVDQSGNHLALTVYGAASNIDLVRYDTRDPSVQLVRWEQVTSDRVRIDVDLRHPNVGYLVLWRAGALVLRVRHLPVIDATSPLRGRVIAVDPGHPPAGSIGPTRLREPEATLAVGAWVKRLLEERGATVIITRTSSDAVALGARAIAARRGNADAFVSIHLNAFADGANPYAAARGSGTFFFQPQSEPLARAVQRGLVHQMGLRDEGVFYNNLAVVRSTWYPAVLAEGAWVVMPEQEAALRTPEFQRAYALGIVDGLEAYFRALVPR